MLRKEQRKRLLDELTSEKGPLRKLALREIVIQKLKEDGQPCTGADIDYFLFKNPDFEVNHREEIDKRFLEISESFIQIPFWESLLGSIVLNFTFVSVLLIAPLISLCEYFSILMDGENNIQQRGMCLAGIIFIALIVLASAVNQLVKKLVKEKA